jgi:hypothetical protein
MEPTIRFLKVSPSSKARNDDTYSSKITLEGDWLENCGFVSGDLITIKIERRKLVITPRSKKDFTKINKGAVDLSNVNLSAGDIVYPYFGRWGIVKREILKATLEGERYRVTSIPCHAPGIALNDLIDAEQEFGHLFFKRIAKRSGNCTIHLRVRDTYWEKIILPHLESLGCTWNNRTKQRFSINVPRTASLKEITDFLDWGKSQSALEYER